MNIPTSDDLAQLTERGTAPRVSLYMPTHRAGPATRQDPIRLKNLLSQAEEGLVEAGLRRTIAKDHLAPVWQLQEDYEFWQHQSSGLAIFVEDDFMRYYRVPLPVPEFAVVTPRFHLKPLLPIFTNDMLFYVLALSLNSVRVLECTPVEEQEIEVPDMPSSMADALGLDEKERLGPSATRRGGTTTTLQGGSELNARDDILSYFRRVDAALSHVLRDSQAPLIVAAVGNMVPIYREASTYPYLLDEHIGGSPEEVPADELREKGWQIARGRIEDAIEAAAARYDAMVGTGLTSNRVAEAAVAASNGRVDVAFVAVGEQRWGSFDAATNTAVLREEPEPGDQDMLDFIAVRTRLGGGSVHVLPPDQIPGGEPVAALYRY